jgi:hypothetical protein
VKAPIGGRPESINCNLDYILVFQMWKQFKYIFKHNIIALDICPRFESSIPENNIEIIINNANANWDMVVSNEGIFIINIFEHSITE